MKMSRIIMAVMASVLAIGTAAASQPERAVRRHVAVGNELFNEKRYAEAEAEFKKAFAIDSTSSIVAFDLATTLLRQAGAGEAGKQLTEQGSSLLMRALKQGDERVAQAAAYNLGNVAYNGEKWDDAIAMYKEALRRNPDDEAARQNLRLAQLKKKEQEQNQDKQQQQQQQQEQQKDQNQEEQQKPPQQQPPEQKQPEQPQKGSISDQNAEQILRAMENQEAATRRRVQEAERREKANATRRRPAKPW